MTIFNHLGNIHNFKINRNTKRGSTGLAPMGARSRLRSGRYGYRMSRVNISNYFDDFMLSG